MVLDDISYENVRHHVHLQTSLITSLFQTAFYDSRQHIYMVVIWDARDKSLDNLQITMNHPN